MLGRPKPRGEYVVAVSNSLKGVWEDQINEDEQALKITNQEHQANVPKSKTETFEPSAEAVGSLPYQLQRCSHLQTVPAGPPTPTSRWRAGPLGSLAG
jgi:hypothetical protein